MRKLFILLFLINIAMSTAFAAETQNEVTPLAGYDGYWDDSTITSESSALAVFTLDLRSYRYNNFEFWDSANKNITEISLKPVGDGTASVDLQLHYDIISSTAVKFYLSADGPIRSENESYPTLNWSLIGENGNRTYFDTANAEDVTSDQNILDIGFTEGIGKYTKEIPLTVKTDSYADLPFDTDYYANIILTIIPS